MKLFNQSQPLSLHARVRQHFLWLTLTLFLLFSLMTVFIIFSLEDAIFKDQLQQNQQVLKQGGTLPSGYSLIEKSQKFSLPLGEQFKYFEFEDNFGEFKRNGKHFHFMKTEYGVLLLDSSERGIFSRIIDDVLLLLFIIFLPSLGLTYWASSKLSGKALKPFTQVYQAIANEEYQIEKVKKAVDEISEQDIKLLATKLVSALEQKTNMLEEQIVFNQGMAHEIRTPLQVMSHSIELMEASSDKVIELPAFNRLNKAVVRMNRISTALLWLTSNAVEAHKTEVSAVLNNVLVESQLLLKTHEISVQVNAQHKLNLPIPEVVLELIIFNLLTNVIHHCQTVDAQKEWQIEITQNSVTFTNPIEEDTNHKTTQGFGLGLILVKRLTEKFGITFNSKQENSSFMVSLDYKS